LEAGIIARDNYLYLNIREFQCFRDEKGVVEVDRVGVGEARDEVRDRCFLVLRNRDEVRVQNDVVVFLKVLEKDGNNLFGLGKFLSDCWKFVDVFEHEFP